MIDAEVLSWLLEEENPSARYLTLTRLLGRAEDAPDVADSRAAITDWGPARAILDAQWPDGYWMRPGIGYSPKHKATVWQVIFLADLGAPRTEAIERACRHILDHNRLSDGRFSAYKSIRGAIACLNGNLLRAMLKLGYEDQRLSESLEVLAEAVVRDGFCCRFNALGGNGAGFPCAWGAIKTLGAFAQASRWRWSPAISTAVEAGIDFLLSGDLVTGEYPTATEPSLLWSRFGFPLAHTSDLLEGLEVFGQLGAMGNSRLAQAVDVVRNKQDGAGRWLLEYTPENKWARFGRVGQPNKWITLRALWVLRNWEADLP